MTMRCAFNAGVTVFWCKSEGVLDGGSTHQVFFSQLITDAVSVQLCPVGRSSRPEVREREREREEAMMWVVQSGGCFKPAIDPIGCSSIELNEMNEMKLRFLCSCMIWWLCLQWMAVVQERARRWEVSLAMEPCPASLITMIISVTKHRIMSQACPYFRGQARGRSPTASQHFELLIILTFEIPEAPEGCWT